MNFQEVYMHKSIIKILLLTLCPVLLLAIIILGPTLMQSKPSIDNRTIKLNIINNKLFVEDIIVLGATTETEFKYKYFDEYYNLQNVTAFINNFPLNYQQTTRGIIHLDNGWVQKYNITDTTAIVKIKYELDSDYITRYTDKDCLPIYINCDSIKSLKDLTILLSSQNYISNLSIKDALVSKSGNSYTINMKNINKTTTLDMLFNINANIQNTSDHSYDEQMFLEESKDYEFITDRIPLLIGVFILSVVIFIVGYLINKTPKAFGYKRDTSNLISPSLAEIVIDGKTNIKDLIMATIVDLNTRGNIEIISNDEIRLVHVENLEPHEKIIVDLLFRYVTRVHFKHINNIFIDSNEDTLKFSDKLKQIKNCIADKLSSMGIISHSLTKLNHIISLIAILICINAPLLFLQNIYSYNQLFLVVDLLIIMHFIFPSKNTSELIEKSNRGRKKPGPFLFITILGVLAGFIFTLIFMLKYTPSLFIIALLTFSLNIYTAITCRKTILSKQGKLEKLKLLELKKFIIENSLLKDRELKSVIIWDKYLAYATAFGIPNNVTDTIYEHWYNLNIFLQVIDSMLF